MSTPNLTSFPAAGRLPDTAPSVDHPRAERRLEGCPTRETWMLYSNPGSGIEAGIWQCEPGRWRIAFPAGEDEYFHVLSGRVAITSLTGERREYGPGDACVIPAGFEGDFHVLETVRKQFVLVTRAA